MEKQQFIQNYQIHKLIGQGSFGQIYQTDKNGVIYAVKTQTISTVKPMVILEYNIYRELHQLMEEERISVERGFDFPKVYQYGEKQHFSFLVMDKLDSTLQDLANIQLENQIPKDVLLLVMYNTLKSIQKLHCLGYLYRDVKPSNFMLKRSQIENQKGKIYLIDLGLCKKYTRKDNQEHIKQKINKKMIGTPIFCSQNTHKGFQTSRRDDLQSWIYMITYLVKKLPWEDYSLRKDENKNATQTPQAKQSLYDKIGKIKESTNISNLIKSDDKLPLCLNKIYESIKHLQFESRPCYENYYQFIQQEYNKLTGAKTSLSQLYFRVKTAIDENKPKERKNIKITFKIPDKKKPAEVENKIVENENMQS